MERLAARNYCAAKKQAAAAVARANKATDSCNAPCKTSTQRTVIEKSPLHRQENDEKTTISVDVAGFSIEQLKIEIEDHVLTLSGKRTNKLGDTFVTQRRFALKQDIYDEDSVEAHLEDGVLDLVVQKKAATRPRMIPITFVPPTPSSFVAGSAAPATSGVSASSDENESTSDADTPKKEDSAAAHNEEQRDVDRTETPATSSPANIDVSGLSGTAASEVAEEEVSVETVDEDEEVENEGGQVFGDGVVTSKSEDIRSGKDEDEAWEEVLQEA